MSLWQALYAAQDWLLGHYLDDLTYSAQDDGASRRSRTIVESRDPALSAYVASLR